MDATVGDAAVRVGLRPGAFVARHPFALSFQHPVTQSVKKEKQSSKEIY